MLPAMFASYATPAPQRLLSLTPATTLLTAFPWLQ